MSEQLEQLAACNSPWAAKRASHAMEIKGMYESGEISESEFQELMQDLVRSDKLEEEADDLELKNMLVSAIMIAGKLA